MATKAMVHDYWNANVCDAPNGKGQTGRSYYEAIERSRIGSLAFMQPTLYYNKKVLEVGVGSGVDFVQWCKAGCEAVGIDLTEAGIQHCKDWLSTYRLVGRVAVGDAENLVFADNLFDLVYSWGNTPHRLPAFASPICPANSPH